GSSPASEPETKNLVWLMDRYQYIYAYLDVHGAHGAIVYPWGDDATQTTDPNMNFRNASYDGQRDPNEASYSEYMPPEDVETFDRLGRAFSTTLNEVRGSSYSVMPSVQLDPSISSAGGGAITVIRFRATTGANDDYAYSRHLSNAALGKIHAFTIEYGSPIAAGADAEEVVAGFQPYIFGEGANILWDLYAGTIGFCLEAEASLPSARSRLAAAALAALVIIIIIIITRCGG
ncbi:MAG TPA: M14 family zinc carboxypeptidase, partial [Polyangiaceae bacterium]|nr:M14 family zinc carboxypeptidase [Polyangiaceae bacterium]